MKKIRTNTTISPKHYALLEKHTQEFKTKQKVIEHALECLENNTNQNAKLSPEEKLWISLANATMVCLVQKDYLKTIMETADMDRLQEYTKREKPFEFEVELSLDKPLKECNLEEILNMLVINHKMCHVCDTVDYIDNEDHYLYKITHSLGLNHSKAAQIMYESLFKTYGVKYESSVSEKTVFVKIFKES